MKSESQIRRIFAHNENLSFAYLWQPAHIEYAVQVHVLSLLACMWCIIQSFIAASPYLGLGKAILFGARSILTWRNYPMPQSGWNESSVACSSESAVMAVMAEQTNVLVHDWPIPGQRIWREFQRAWNCNFDQLHQLDNWKNWWIGTENVLPLVPFQKSFWGKYWRRTLCQVLSPRLTVWLLQCEIVQLSLFYQALQWLWLDCEFEGESVNCAQFAR